jgi:hypothetical protein
MASSQGTQRNRQKKNNWQAWRETSVVPKNIQFSFSYSFLHSKTAQFNLDYMRPLAYGTL